MLTEISVAMKAKYKHLADPPLWKKDVRRSKQSSTTYFTSFSHFSKGLFFVWKNSIWQAIFVEYMTWLALFYVVFAAYRLSNEKWQERFDVLFLYCKNFQGLLPLPFILGFYVSTVFGRWWSQWQAIPWIGKMAMIVHDLDAREDEEGLHVRWTFLRYMLLGMAITFQRISTSFRILYPDMKSIQDVGIVSEREVTLLEEAEAKVELPFVWAADVIRKQERNHPDRMCMSALRLLRTELIEWRTANAILRGFNNHPIPIAMINIIGFGVYAYFFAAIFSRQFFINKELAPSTTPTFKDGTPADFYFPFFGSLEFVFYVGWFKVSAMMYDPFSTHGCEHVLQRVWDEEVSWARQGAGFKVWRHTPEDDTSMNMDKTFPRIPFSLRYEEQQHGPLLSVDETDDGLIGDESGTYDTYLHRAATRSRTASRVVDSDALSQPLLMDTHNV
eukprot:m.39241 g.39241  ORF g.39241 m.39241 type:complete len:445 (-) comp10281_c0_seq1:2119-3453(-)